MILFLTALAVLLIDQGSKIAVRSFLAPKEYIVLLNIKIIHFANPGSALGILPYYRYAYIALTLMIIAIIIVYSLRYKPNKKMNLACGLFLGAAVGNLADRVFYGRITDFVSAGKAVFNVADIAIVIGILIVLWNVYQSVDSKSGNNLKSIK